MTWPTCKISDVFNVARGGSPRPIQNYLTDAPDGLNWIMIGDASDSSKYIKTTKKRIKPEGLNKTRMVSEGDFLLTNSMSFGRPYILKTSGCIHDGWLVLSPKNGKVFPDFFYYLLGSDALYREFSKRAAGAVVKNLNTSLVKKVQIPLPPLAEQKRIAGILDAADALRVKRREAISQLDALLQSTFLEMFGDPVTNPRGWKSISDGSSQFGYIEELDNIADVIDCKHRTPIYTNEGYPVVRPRDVREGGIHLEGCLKTTVEEFADLTEKRCPSQGDIVYSRNATFGVASLIQTTQKFAIGQDVCLIVPRALNSEYLYYLLNSHFVRRQLGLAISGSTFKRINLKAIRKLKILVPSDELQKKFALFYTKQQLVRQQLLESARELDTLFDSLQSRAFNGEL